MAYLISMDELESFLIEPGESGYIMEGKHHGFENSSAIITTTSPGGGPRWHIHTCEEVHILLEGHMRYAIGDERFDAHGPYVVNIPAGIPHAFTNAGEAPIRLICFFPSPDIWPGMTGLGPNPLLPDAAASEG
jgi:mannose-6-phosphate isomerase-like protein (cupin superfamily)